MVEYSKVEAYMKNKQVKKFNSLRFAGILFVLAAFALIVMVGCGKTEETLSARTSAAIETKEEKTSEKLGETKESESKKDSAQKKETKEIKDVKASKPLEGGLKQELSTTAKVDLKKNEFTFEVPYSQLHGLKVGDAMVINQGNKAYPAKIMTIPTVDQSGIRPDAKYIITASLGPGVTLPGANVPYTATYLYNNRTPNVHYVNKNYVYYDGPRAYVYATSSTGRVRKKYIRTGLVNKYYIEILDDWDVVDRIIEDHLDYIDYLEDIIIENIIDDSHDEIIIDYTDYIESLNDRWDFDDEVNEFVVDDVNEIDWKKLEDDDVILNDEDIEEIDKESAYSGGGDFEESSAGLENQYSEDNTSDDDSYSGSGDFEESTHEAYVEPSTEDDNNTDDTDGGYSGGGSFDDNTYVTEEETEDHDYSGGGSFEDDNSYSGGGSYEEDSYSGSGSYDEEYSDGGYSGGGSFDDDYSYSGGGSFETTEDSD